MKKRLLGFIVFFCIVLGLCIAMPLCASAATEGYYTYTVSNGEATITDFDTSVEGKVTIPSTIGGYPVTKIGSYAFEDCTGLTTITIPDSVTSIGVGAFEDCTSLEEITLPFVGSKRGKTGTYDSVFGYIFGYAYSSESGTTSQYYSSSYHDHEYYYIPSSIKKVVITDETAIPYGAFYNCSMLTSVTIPDSVTSIGRGAFSNCNNLVLSANKGSYAATYAYSNGVCFKALDSDNDIFSYLIINNEAKITYVEPSQTESLVVPESFGVYPVTGLGNYSFKDCTGLKLITIPDSVTSIGRGAFKGCTGLTTITIPDNVTSIETYTFEGCTGLTTITIPDSVTSIGEGAFKGCTSLEEITLPFVGSERGKTGTSDSVFGYIFGTTGSGSESGTTCQYYSSSRYDYDYYYIPSSLKKVVITYETAIPYGAFYDCSMLTSVTIPDSVTSIGGEAFSNCNNLVLSANKGSYAATYAYSNGVCFKALDSDNDIFSYVIVDNEAKITYVEPSQTESLVVPESFGVYPVTGLGNYSFKDCTGLKSMTIPDSVTSIGEGAFKGCTSLEEITLPFVGSKRGKSGTSDSVFGYIFGYTTSSDSGTTRQYYSSSDYDYYYIPSSLKKVVITDETAIPYGAFHNCSMLTSVTIPDSVTSIGGEAFRGCTGLTTITIPDSVISIGDYSFYNCSNLTSITIPDSVTSIGEGAFKGCTSLEEITLPFVGRKRGETGTSFSVFGYIFGYTTSSSETGTSRQDFSSYNSNSYYYYYYYIPSSLKKVVITDETVIPYGAFYNCSMLTSVTIPDSVTSIDENAFYNCDDLVISANMTSYAAKYAYNNAICLKTLDSENEYISYMIIDNQAEVTYVEPPATGSLSVPESLGGCPVTSIVGYAFKDCTGLKSITIPKTVLSIHEGAFKGCTSLEEITLPFVGVERGGTGTEDSVFGYIFGFNTFDENDGVRQYYSDGLYDFYAIPSSIKKVVITDEDVIPYGAFYNCNNLNEIVLEEDISMISQKVFANCLSLTDVTVKNTSARYANNPNIFENVDFVTLHGYTDSTTQSYAQTYSIPFEALGGGSGEQPGGDGDEPSFAYEVSSIKVLSSTDGSVLNAIPTGDFIADVSVTNVSSTSKDAIIIAAYDKDGATKSLTYLYATIDKGKTVNLGTVFHNPDGDIVTLKAFVWNSLAGLKPLSGSAVFPK